MMQHRFLGYAALAAATVLALPPSGVAQTTSPHTVTTTKFTIDDVSTSKTFYEDLVGLPELRRYVDAGRLVEPFMGWSEDGRMGLLAYTVREDVKKSPYPVSVVFLPALDPVAARFEAAGQPFNVYELDGGVRLAIVTDPSGNAIELVERDGAPAVGGARLIVDDREEVEQWFIEVFDAKVDNRIVTDTFDEVFLNLGHGMFVALYEPLGADAGPQPKSENPVVAIYSTDYDAVLARIKAGGLPVRERGDRVLFADDPSGNVVEVVRQAP
jgi:catechol 2,3-dioxygenase-like lactoylglutathione lyase family enzyme